MGLIDVTILKVTDPSHFWAKEVPGPSSTSQARQFIRLCEDIDDYCSKDHFLNMHMYTPKKDMVCLANKIETNHWYRARVTSIIQRKHFAEASCLLLDYGETIRVPANRLRDIPNKFLNLSFQARQFSLYGLVPLSLTVSFEDDEAKMKPAKKWDTAAVEFFEELLADKPAKVDIHKERADGVALVTLYVNQYQQLVNVNEELLKLNYATNADEPVCLDETAVKSRSEKRTVSGSSSPCSVSQPVSPDSRASGQSAQEFRGQEVVGSGSEEDKGCSRKTSLREYLGLPKLEQDREQEPETTSNEQMACAKFKELSVGWKNNATQKLSRKVPAKNSHSVQNGDVPEVCHEPVLKRGPTEAATQAASSEKSQEDKQASTTRSKLIAKLQAVASAKKAALSVSDEAGQSNLRKQAEKETLETSTGSPRTNDQPSHAASEIYLRKPSAQLTRLPACTLPHGTKPLLAETMGAKAQPPVRPAFVPTPGLARLPFAIGGKFTLSPKELDSIANDRSLTPPRFLQSVRRHDEKQTRLGDTSSDPEYYNSSSDEPVSYVTPAIRPEKVIGQRLLKQIAPACSTSTTSNVNFLMNAHIKKASRILVHGDQPPRPMLDVEQSCFPESIQKKLYKLDFAGPSDIQAYSWPVILRGVNMVGISTTQSGKSLAFLLPLITQSLQPSNYSSLPPGNGPLVIIVSPRWRKAAEVYDQCCKFLPSQRGSKVILIHGAGSEEQQEVQLLNGCSILVATLSCLLRMIRHDHTNLNRLCHLVLDDADILCEDYTDQVKELMSQYAAILSNRDNHRTTPRQLLLFSSRWTMAIGSFVRSYMADPIAVITSPLESGVYARVRQVVRRVEPYERDALLRSLLESSPTEARRMIIFTNSREQAMQLQEVLHGGDYTLLAFKGMPQHHLDVVKTEWHGHHRNDSLPILVCTDDVIQDVGITSATTVVHFDFPTSKHRLGLRLSCMMDHYASQLKSKSVSDCKSILLISKEHTRLIPGLVNLLNRCSFSIPTQLKVEEAYMENEKSKKCDPLCHQLKAFGECRNKSSCVKRHTMFGDVDSPGCNASHIRLPSSGVIKILITHIVDASSFYARVLEYRTTEASNPIAMPATHLDLAFELSVWFSDRAHRVAAESPVAGDLCGFEDRRQVFHRVKVQRSKRAGSSLFEQEKEVQFVDQGRTKRVSVRRLLKLPDHLCTIPCQAVEIFVCCVKPVDEDTEWTTQAGFFVYDKIHDRQLEGKIILSLDNCLWLDPLIQRVHLPNIKTTVNINNVQQELLKAGFADNNPEHIDNLRKLCEGKVSLPDLVVPSAHESRIQPMLLPDPIYLSPSDDFYPVYVSSVHTPGCLFVQLISYAERLAKVMDEINQPSSKKSIIPKYWQPKVGEVCLAKFHEDERWNRVRIADIPVDGTYEVFYLDYGDREEVPKDWLQPAWNKILMLPFQAIQCSLTDVTPANEQWSDAAGDALWGMCLDGDEKKLLMAKIISEVGQDSESGSARTLSYEIELFDTNSEMDIVIGQQLVHAGYAQGNATFLQSMFPTFAVDEPDEPSLSTEKANKLSELCLRLYQTKIELEQQEICEEIHELMTVLRDCDFSMEVDVIPLCHLVSCGRARSQVNDSLVSTLALACFKNPKNCETLCRNGGLKELCQLLLKTEDEQLHEYISYILMLSSGNSTGIREYGGLEGLCRLLEAPTNANIINQSCTAIAALVAGNSKNQYVVNESGGLTAVCKLLSIYMDHGDCSVSLLRALSKMAANGGTKDEIRDSGGLLALCELLCDTTKSHIVHMVSQALVHLSCNNPENLDLMADHEDLKDAVERHLMCTSHSETTQQLLTKLDIRLIEHSKTRTDQSEQSFHLGGQSNSTLQKTGQAGTGFKTRAGQSDVGSGNKPLYKSKIISIQEVSENERKPAAVDNDIDDMPPLEVISDSSLPRTQPKVLWSQRPNSVVLSVQLRGVLTFDLAVISTGINFSTVLDGTVYAFSLELYGRVRAPEHTAVALGSEVLITLYKESVGANWSRLTARKSKLAFVGVDFERWNVPESDSEEDISYRFGIKKKTLPVRPRTKSGHGNRIPVASIPELDTSESSESSSDDDSGSFGGSGEFGYVSDHSETYEYTQSS